jgi:TetR/AcrR family transcriptional repressor of nem operon
VESVTVAEVMKAAGLTHGAFYGYFASKEDLVAQALARALVLPTGSAGDTPDDMPDDMAAYAATYLSATHRDAPGQGCVFAALGSEVARTPPAVRHELTASVARQIERFSRTAPGQDATERRQAATAGWATMIGAVVLARIVDDPALSDRLLADCRAWLGAEHEDA